MGIDEKVGWWLAPDGNWYPPELQARHAVQSRDRDAPTRIRPMGPRSRFEALHFGGTCVNCGSRIRPHDEGWNDPDINRVMCAECWPAVVASHPSAASMAGGRQTGTGATPPAVVALRRGDATWRPGAEGEYLMSLRLQRELGDHAVVLSDRRVPDSPAVVDHIVVAPSGVWVIHAKKIKGLIEHRHVAGAHTEEFRLLIGGHDRTAMVERVYDYVIPVANVLADPTIPVHGAIAIVEGNWGSPTRLLTRRPYRHDGIWVLWPAALIRLIEAPGPLTTDDLLSAAARLDRGLPPRSA